MSTPHALIPPLALLGWLGLAGCQGGAPERPPAVDLSFAFLLERYDADADGRVTAVEYDRGSDTFARLDRIPDGVLTGADFEATGRRVRGLPREEAQRLRALHLLGWYFQEAGDPLELTEAELRWALERYDENGNGRVGRTEFERLAREQGAFGVRPAGRLAGLLEVETTDPWQRLVDGIDRDVDGFLTAREVTWFLRATAADSTWRFTEHESSLPSVATVGLVAPDFTLPVSGGQGRVTLSSFAGDRPVALIFGSFT